MGRLSFLDKGILLGYCFTVDIHHRKCANYLDDDELEFFITEDIEEAFERNISRIVEDHRGEILDHVRQLKQSDFSGELGPMELKSIRTQQISKGRFPNGWRYLQDFYNQKNLISVGELEFELREMARQIESKAKSRKNRFDGLITMWERETGYPEVESALEELRDDDAEDFWVCVDAHDLGARTDDETELATTNPRDFIRSGRRELIIENTEIDDVVEVAVVSRQGS